MFDQLERQMVNCDDLWKAIGNICNMFSDEECLNYFVASGYGFTIVIEASQAHDSKNPGTKTRV